MKRAGENRKNKLEQRIIKSVEIRSAECRLTKGLNP